MWTTFEAPGGVLSYQRRGSGPLVVCIPGGPGMDPEAYFAAMDLPGYEMLIYAPRGTGLSADAEQRDGYLTAAYVADLECLRLHLGLEQLRLYGNSHGAVIALAYACRHREHVERLILTNGPARIDETYRDAVAETQRRFAMAHSDGQQRLDASAAADAALDGRDLADDERRSLFRTLMARYVANEGPAERDYLDGLCSAPMNWAPSEVMYDEFVAGLDLLEEAVHVTTPALVIAGEYDVTVPPASMRLIAEAMPNAQYLEFPGVGHFVEVEAAETFTAAVTAFLAS